MFLIHAVYSLQISRVKACWRSLRRFGDFYLWLEGPWKAQSRQRSAQSHCRAGPKPTRPLKRAGRKVTSARLPCPKKPKNPPKDDAPKAPKKVDGLDNFSMRVSSQLVTVDVGVLSKDGVFIPGLKKEYFRVLEDNVPQTISSFSQIQAPITAVMLVEFSNNQYFYNFQIESIKASYVSPKR